MTLWRRYLLGMLTGAGSVVIKTGLNLLVIPMFLARLGPDVFGLYMLLIGLLELSMLLDMGIADALVNLLGGEDPGAETARPYLKVGHGLFIALSLLLTLAGFLLLPVFDGLFHIDSGLAPMAHAALLLMLAEIVLTMYGGYYQAVLIAHCSHQWSNLAETFAALVANLGALILLWMGFDLIAVLMVRVLAAGLRLLMLMMQAIRIEPNSFFPDAPFERQALRQVIALSGHAMTINLSIIVSHKIDVIVIALFLPLRFVGIYEIVFRFLGFVIQICLKLVQGAYPVFAKMAAAGQRADARLLFLRMSAFLNFTACLLMLLVVCHYDMLFGLLSAGKIPVRETYPILWVAVPIILSGALQMPAGAWLFNWGFQKYLTVSSVSAAVANLLLSLLLVRTPMGIIGVALGTMIPQLIQHQGSLIYKTCRELGISLREYLLAVHGSVLVPLALAFCWIQACRHLMGNFDASFMGFIMMGLSTIAIVTPLWFMLTATPFERVILHEKFWAPMRARWKQTRVPGGVHG